MLKVPERLTHEKKIGPFGALKEPSANQAKLFSDYDGFFAYMVAVTRLQMFEDLLDQGRILVLPEDQTVKSLIKRIQTEKKREESESAQPSPSYTTGYSAGTHIGMANILTELTKLYTQDEEVDLQSLGQ